MTWAWTWLLFALGVVQLVTILVLLSKLRRAKREKNIVTPQLCQRQDFIPPRLDPPPTGPTVLIVDDEVAFLNWMRRIMVRMNYRVVTCSSHRDVRALLASGRRVDAVITDVVLIGSTGRLIADMVKTSAPHVPVLFVSGYSNVHVAGGCKILQKPFTEDQLMVSLHQAMAEA